MNNIKKLKEIIDKSNDIVFFGGAGVSTESGIKDFRSIDGLYNQDFEYRPEEILSHDFFINKPEIYFDFHKKRLINLQAKPNNAHIALANLEKKGKLNAVITQNIDSLHTLAGSKNVIELHGSASRNYCTNCKEFYDINFILNSTNVPKCTKCNNIIKPDIVLYGEMLNSETIEHAINQISNADLLIIGGTSLVVQPACSLIHYFKGQYLVLINKEPTPKDYLADILIREPISKVFESMCK